jgi:hypothetical protein
MHRVFKVELSQKGIEKLIKDLKNYRDVILPNRCKELVERLAEIGIQTAKVKINESPLGHYISIRTNIEPSKMGCKAILISTGESFVSDEYDDFNTLLAVEFGAGIHYNEEPSPNPKATEFGFGVGTFPNQTHARDENGWYFWDEKSQSWKHTYGVKATMPMYSASVEIIRNIQKIALEVFAK